MIGPNVESTPLDLAEKFWENVQEAARQEDCYQRHEGTDGQDQRIVQAE